MAGNIKGITIEIGGETTGLQKALSSVNKQSKDLQSELKQVENLLKFNPGNAELIAQKQKLLADQVANTSKKLDQLKEAQSQVDAQFASGKISPEQYRAFQREIVATEGSLNGLKNKMADMQAEQERVASSTKQLNTLFEATGSSVDDYADVLGSRLVNAIKDGTASSKQLDTALSKIGQEALGSSADIDKMKQALSSVDDGASLDSVKKDLSNVAKEAEQAGDEVNGFGTELANVIAGLATGGGIAGAIGTALDTSSLNTKIEISMEVPESSKKSVKDAINTVSSYGVDAEAALEGVRRQWALNKDASDESNQAVVNGAATIVAAYSGVDFTELIQETNEISKTLGITNEEALALTNSLLKAGFPPEQLDIIAEYGTQLKMAGYNAQEIQALFAAGVDTGTWNIDNLMDGLKEGRIRVAEFGNEVPKALAGLVDGTDISTKKLQKWGEAVAAGGEGGSQAMVEIATALNGVDDETKKNLIGVQLFGTIYEDQGQNIIDTLLNAKNSTVDLKDSQDQLNESTSKLDASPAVAMQQALSDMQTALAPLLTTIAEVVAKVAEWVQNNPTLTATIAAVASAIGIIVGAAMALAPIFTAISSLAGTLGISIGALAGPIGWAVLAIVGLIAAGVAIYKNWDEISAYATEVWGSIIGYLSDIWNSIAETASGIWVSITETFTSALDSTKEIASNIWNGIKELILSIWASIKEASSNTWESMKETTSTIWSAIVDSVNAILTPFVTGVQDFFNNMKDGVSQIMEGFKSVFEGVWEAIKNIFLGALLLIVDLVTGDFEKLKSDSQAIFNNLKSAFQSIWNGIKKIFSGAVDAIKGFVQTAWNHIKTNTTNAFNTIKTFLSNTWTGIKSLIKTSVDGIKTGVTNAWNGIKSITSSVWNGIKSFISNTVSNIKSGVVNGFNSLKSSVSTAMNNVKTAIETGWNKAKSFLTNIDLASIGKNIIQGLVNGISSMTGAIRDKVKAVADSVTSTLRNVLDIHSPSRETHKIGEQTGQGFRDGIAAKQASVEEVSRKIAASAKKAFNTDMKNLSLKFKADKIDISEYINSLQSMKGEYAKVPNALAQIDAQIVTLKKKNIKELFDEDKKYYANKSKDADVSMAEEIAILETLSKHYKKNTDERIYFENQIKQQKQKIAAEIDKINADYLKNVENLNKSLIDGEKKLNDEYAKAVSDRTKSLYSFVGLFENVVNTSLNGQVLIDNLKTQVTAFENWESDITELSKKAIDKGLLEELRAMGPKAKAEISGLNTLSAEQLDEYVELWRTKNKLAADQAIEELKPLKSSTAKQIEELRKSTGTELKKYIKEWQKAMSSVMGDVKFSTKDMNKAGQDIANGLLKGLLSKNGELYKAAKSMAATITKTLKSELKIKSPSRVMIEIGKNIGEGILLGLDSNFTKISEMSSKIADAATPDFSEKIVDLPYFDYVQYGKVIKQATNDGKNTYEESIAFLQGYVDIKKNLLEMSAKEELYFWQSAYQEYGADNEIGLESYKKYMALKEILNKEQFEKEKAWIDQSVKYKDMSLADELKAYEEYIKNYAENSEQQIYYAEQILRVNKEISDEIVANAEAAQQALEDQYEAQQKLIKDGIAELDKFAKDLTDAISNKYKLELEVSLTNVSNLFDKILIPLKDAQNALDEQFSSEDQTNKMADLRNNLAKARTEKDRKDIQKLMDEENKKMNREQQKKTIQAAIDQAELEKSQAEAGIKAKYEAMMTQEAIEQETRKLILENNEEEIVSLLKSYNSDWQDAGQSFGEKLVEGLNSMKTPIQAAVESIVSMAHGAIAELNNSLTFATANGIQLDTSSLNQLTDLGNTVKPIYAPTIPAPSTYTQQQQPIILHANIDLDGQTVATQTWDYTNTIAGNSISSGMRYSGVKR